MEDKRLDTPLGPITVWSCGKDSEGNMHIGSRTYGDTIQVNGVEYRLRLDVWVTPEGSVFMEDRGTYKLEKGYYSLDREDHYRTGKHTSDAARKKARAILTPILVEFIQKNPPFCYAAELAALEQTRQGALFGWQEAEKKAQEAQATLVRATEALTEFHKRNTTV